MQLIQKKNTPYDHNLFLFGDLHMGNKASYEKGIDLLIRMISGEYEGIGYLHNYGICMGDAGDYVTIDDYRYDPKVVEPEGTYPLTLTDAIVDKFKPVSEHMLALICGTHERKIHAFGDLAENLANRLNVSYGGWKCKVSFKDRDDKLMYKIFCTHGSKTINSCADDPKRVKSNMELTLKRHLKNKAGDCILMAKGHTHRLLVNKPEPVLWIGDNGEKLTSNYFSGNNNGYIHPDNRWYINTGSFLRTDLIGVSTYSERFEYDPVELGFAIVLVRDGIISEVHRVVMIDGGGIKINKIKGD
jgi:hypothetical protein